MVEYSKVNVKSSGKQLKKLESVVKNKSGTTLRMIFKMFDRNDLPYELSLTARQKTNLRNAFNNNMSADIKLTKAQISKIIQSGWFLGSLLSKLADPLIKVAVSLAKNILAPLGIHRKTTLIIANQEMDGIMKIVQARKYSNILLKEVTKTIKNEKEQKWGFFGMLLCTPGANC